MVVDSEKASVPLKNKKSVIHSCSQVTSTVTQSRVTPASSRFDGGQPVWIGYQAPHARSSGSSVATAGLYRCRGGLAPTLASSITTSATAPPVVPKSAPDAASRIRQSAVVSLPADAAVRAPSRW